MLKLKENINIIGLRPEMLIAIIAANSACDAIGVDCVITSALDGKHSLSSLHYTGQAIDIRINNMTKSQSIGVSYSLQDALGQQYDVILEENHIHIEFQPKYNSRFNG